VRLIVAGAAGTLFAGCASTPPAEGAPTVIGTVSAAAPVACPSGAPAGASCSQVTVSCPGLDDLGVVVAVTEPAAPPIGTVLLHNNVGGTVFFDAGFVAGYLGAGLRVVQPAWASDWETSPVGLKHAACRYATLLSWAFTTVHGADRGHGFCAQSYGGGSGGLAFSLAFYGAGDFLDAALVNAGPPFSRVDLGCAPGTPPRPACSAIPAAPVAYSDGVLSIISGWEAAPACGAPGAPASEVARWQADSILSPGALLSFPRTSLGAFYCANAPDATVGQGSLFFDAVTSEAQIHCVTGGAGGGACSGEDPWPSALPDMVADLAARCTPRH
jgi:hypothetical protein